MAMIDRAAMAQDWWLWLCLLCCAWVTIWKAADTKKGAT